MENIIKQHKVSCFLIITLLAVFSSRSLQKQQTSSGETELVPDFDVHTNPAAQCLKQWGPRWSWTYLPTPFVKSFSGKK